MDNFFENKVISEKLLKERIIMLDEEINSKSAGNIVSKLLYLNSEGDEDIKLYINSPGGEVSSGLMIIDTMNLISCDVQTISIGTSASMAAIILMSGTKGKRMILPNSKVMIHDLFGEAKGKFNDVLTEFEEMNKTRKTICNIISNNTAITNDQLENCLKKDFWINSSEAVKYGIVDKVITKEVEPSF